MKNGLIVWALFSALSAYSETIGFSTSLKSSLPAGQLSVSVQDDFTLTPIENADVTLSNSPGTPGVSRKTGASGESLFQIPNEQPRTVKVSKTGYATSIVIGSVGNQLTVFLKSILEEKTVIASGNLPNWPSFKDDSIVHGGIVVQSASIFDLLHFDASLFVSPLKDSIDIFGPRQIPSNVVIPPQTISYGVPISLNKPLYRLPIVENRPTRLMALQGQIPVADIASAGGAKKFSYALLNKMTVTGVGLTESLASQSDFQKDIPTNWTLQKKYEVDSSRPPFPADIIAVSVTDYEGDRETLVPTDIKTAAVMDDPSVVSSVVLNSESPSSNRAHGVVTVAIGDKNRRISGIVNITESESIQPGSFLNIDDQPDSPSLPETLQAQAPNDGVSSIVFEGLSVDQKQTHPIEYVFVMPSAGKTEIQTTDLSSEKISKYATTLLDFGAAFDETSFDGKTAMLHLNRFARASSKITP